jgi:hypothetical protein
VIAVHELAARVARRSVVDPAWPIVLLTVGMPLAYVVGVSAIVWVIPGVVFGLALFRSSSVRVPKGALPLVALTVWVLVTIVRVAGVGMIPLFVYRWLLWASALACMVWLANDLSSRVSSARVVRLLAALWIVLVVFGYLAMLFPSVQAPSFVQSVLVGRLGHPLPQPSFLYDLTVVRFAELQEFVGNAVPRPAAPMAYTNGWGSTIGLLTPFFACSWLCSPGRLRRNIGIGLAVAALVPMIVSTNRGLWVSLAVAVLYFGVRRTIAGDARVLIAVVLAGAFVVIVTLATPLSQVVSDRFSGAEASNATRERLYDTAFEQSTVSPLLGYGAPDSVEDGPAIGTHGLLWYTMFSHGFPAVALLFTSTVALLVATFRARTRIALAAHLAIVVFAVQIPFYGLFPQIVLIGLAAGLAWRENRRTDVTEVARW